MSAVLAAVCQDDWRKSLAVAAEILAGFVGLGVAVVAFGLAIRLADGEEGES